jgi:hypothetical protein
VLWHANCGSKITRNGPKSDLPLERWHQTCVRKAVDGCTHNVHACRRAGVHVSCVCVHECVHMRVYACVCAQTSVSKDAPVHAPHACYKCTCTSAKQHKSDGERHTKAPTCASDAPHTTFIGWLWAWRAFRAAKELHARLDSWGNLVEPTTVKARVRI